MSRKPIQLTIEVVLALIVGLTAVAAIGCKETPADNNANTEAATNANENANTSSLATGVDAKTAAAGTNSNAAGPAADSGSGSFAIREPERYSLKMNISLEGSADNRQGSLQLEIDFARINANRLWTLKVPAINQEVSYLEKPGLKYIVIPTRSQYVELTAESIGFPLGDVMSPAGMMTRLQTRPHESFGSEMINGRPAWKYRFTGSANTGTTAGTAQADSFVYVDKETTLPLRIDLSATTTSGAAGRGIVETRDIHLNPDPGQFEIPIGFQKVTAEQLKMQVQGFIALVRALAPYLNGQGGQQGIPPPPPPTPSAATNSNRSATKSNANRR